jgi:alkanesulfonate monooxygenase SsuD/methylene tetrahydromethanopterin reductase-like flavin-dependent oxidoreductase (luciferase family)
MGSSWAPQRFEEACELIVGLLTQETTTFSGRYYQLTEARNEPKPVQRPHPPICIGGSGERRTLRTAARFAQHWNFVGGTPEEFARKRRLLYEHCETLGRNPEEILLSSHVIFTGDPQATAEQAAALSSVGAELGIVYLRPPLDPSVLEPLANVLRGL